MERQISAVVVEEQAIIKTQEDIVYFTIKPRKEGVKWSEDTVDNENLNKKKSKSNKYIFSSFHH